MFKNHLFQLLTIIAMEQPARFEADGIRDKKMDVLKAIRPFDKADLDRNALRAQYKSGRVDGRKVPGYREEEGISPGSLTPTLAALRLEIDNPRWKGVPFYLRSGKRMSQGVTEIFIQFKPVSASMFQPFFADQISPNRLRFRIHPDEGISICFEAKHPGPKLCMSTVTMDFSYQDTFGTPPPEAYSRLFLDAMIGDQTLFARNDEVEQAWKILDPILKFWEAKGKDGLFFYPAGSWGPSEIDDFLAREGRRWDFPYTSC